MGIALRLLEGFVGASVVGFTVVWGWALSSRYSDFGTFVGETVPFPLILPILVGILTIINIELLAGMIVSSGDEEAILTETEQRVRDRIERGSRTVASWNSRWDRSEEETRD